MTGDVEPFVVTLVHGTFARGAAWANDADALMRRRLHAAFGDAVRLRAFNWSGGNSHPHRWRAAEELRADQAALAQSEPGLPRFVVAHSHGGNVALYALGTEAPPPELAGIVTMGTPFIDCRPRRIESGMAVLRWALPLLVLLFGVPLLGLLALLLLHVVKDLLSGNGRWLALLVVSLYTASAAIQLSVLAFRRMPRLHAWAQARQQGLLARLRLPAAPVPMLCVHVAGDEAGRWLGLTRAAGELPYAFWRKSSLAVLLVATAVLAYAGVVSGIHGYGPVATHLIAGLVALLAAGLQVLLFGFYWQLVMAALPMITRAHCGAYGGEGLFHNWLLRIGTSVLPADAEHRVTAHACALAPGTRGLRHSGMYGDDAVIETIAAWMRQRLRDRGVARPDPRHCAQPA